MSRVTALALQLAPQAPETPAAEPEAAPPKPAKWPRLSAPVYPLDTLHRSRAQSALCGLQFRDGSTAAPVLTLEQARDVLAWYRPSWYRVPN